MRFNNAIEDHLTGLICAGVKFRQLSSLTYAGEPNAVTIAVDGIPRITLSYQFVGMKLLIHETYHDVS